MDFKIFDYAEHKTFDPENNLDPDNNYFNHNHSIINSEYYTDEQFNTNIELKNTLSVIHLNSRSLDKNFTKIKEYLTTLKKFTIIAI